MQPTLFSTGFFVTNIFFILVLVMAFVKPRLAAIWLTVIFAGAAVVNMTLAIRSPESYLAFADVAVFEIYVRFIRGSFSAMIPGFILSIAAIQLLIGAGIWGKPTMRQASLWGAILFLWAISPLGAGSAFPAPVWLAAACAVLLWKDAADKRKHPPGKGQNGQPSSGMQEERYFLEGPRSRLRELFFLIQIVIEFVRGFRTLHFVPPCIAIFGSARVLPGSRFYETARKMGSGVAGLGFAVMTGGGPGIMEAASRGAKEAGGTAIGCNIRLPHEQKPNPWLDKYLNCRFFFVRKVLMFKYSYGFIIMPGGIGTLDEFYEALTLIQTKKILDFPIVLMGKDYWDPVTDMMGTMLKENMISSTDLNYIMVTDDPDEALQHMREFALMKYNVKRKKIYRKFVFLGE
ncbi:LOG family protein [Chitinophaga lutea]|nr:TIGR00730 family Rossman fold protein [Chitinophaga lutea]